LLRFYVDSQLRVVSTGAGQYSGDLYDLTYDSANNVVNTVSQPLTRTPDPQWYFYPHQSQTLTYGPHGNVLTQTTDGFADTVTTSWLNASKYFQKQSVTTPLGTTSFDYFTNTDASVGNRGEVMWARDARYATTGKQFSYQYNQYGQKTQEQNLNDVVTTFTYGDAWGNLTQTVQDPGTGHLNRTTSMVYDVAGRVTSSTDPKAQQSSFQFNGVGQPTIASLPGETVTYGYGTNGRTESVTDNRGQTVIAYQTGNDIVASVTDPVTGQVGYTYGLAGERRTMTLPGGGVWTYQYADGTSWGASTAEVLPKDDPNSLAPMLSKITDDQNRVVEYYLDQHGRVDRARTNESYSGTALVSYLEARYWVDGVSNSHGWTSEVKNTWNVKGMYG
jgi:YD repeat-containing protein